jgi:hypothetical protein
MPAVPSEDSVEAEVVSLDDPILAGLKIGVKAAADEVVVRLEGKPVEQASLYGEAELDSAIDHAGNKIYLMDTNERMSGRYNNPEFQKNRAETHFQIVDQPRPKQLRELRGSVALRTGGRLEAIIVKNIFENAGQPIVNERLKSLGVSVCLTSYRKEIEAESDKAIDCIMFDLAWKQDAVVHHLELLDGQGTPIEKKEGFAVDGNNSVTWECFYKKAPPQDAQLRIVVHKDSRKVRVPFVIKNIEIPPMPKK